MTESISTFRQVGRVSYRQRTRLSWCSNACAPPLSRRSADTHLNYSTTPLVKFTYSMCICACMQEHMSFLFSLRGRAESILNFTSQRYRETDVLRGGIVRPIFVPPECLILLVIRPHWQLFARILCLWLDFCQMAFVSSSGRAIDGAFSRQFAEPSGKAATSKYTCARYESHTQLCSINGCVLKSRQMHPRK